jgi:hypothetical protein
VTTLGAIHHQFIIIMGINAGHCGPSKLLSQMRARQQRLGA